MPLKIVRNDITKMDTEAIVNTANDHATVGTGCDSAVYKAAGYEELLGYRKEKIGFVPEGEVFLTPGFGLKARYIIHAVSPHYAGGSKGEEQKLRSCYAKSLQIAAEKKIRSIAFPLIATGGFGYPKEEGLRIAVDEINAFLLNHEMLIYLVVFDSQAAQLGEKIYPDLEEYIDHEYICEKTREEYELPDEKSSIQMMSGRTCAGGFLKSKLLSSPDSVSRKKNTMPSCEDLEEACLEALPEDFEEEHLPKLEARMEHISDTFSEYLLYLIAEKRMKNSEVYKNAIVDKKTFSKIKNHPDYHPEKRTALCLCVGAKLNLDETRDLLARAGYALSPCDKTDIIFSYFIENQIYDMIELDIQLEEHGLPCIIH